MKQQMVFISILAYGLSRKTPGQSVYVFFLWYKSFFGFSAVQPSFQFVKSATTNYSALPVIFLLFVCLSAYPGSFSLPSLPFLGYATYATLSILSCSCWQPVWSTFVHALLVKCGPASSPSALIGSPRWGFPFSIPPPRDALTLKLTLLSGIAPCQ